MNELIHDEVRTLMIQSQGLDPQAEDHAFYIPASMRENIARVSIGIL